MLGVLNKMIPLKNYLILILSHYAILKQLQDL